MTDTSLTNYTNYYTSADTFLYVETDSANQGNEPVFLDRLETIAFNESVSARPVYGIGQPVFGFTNLGNLVVSGQLSLRFVHEDYLVTAIKSALQIEAPTRASISRSQFLSQTTTQDVRDSTEAERYAASISNSRLLDLPYYFNFRLVFNNENQYHKDSFKTLVIKDVRIISSQQVSSVSTTGPMNVNYNFIARLVK